MGWLPLRKSPAQSLGTRFAAHMRTHWRYYGLAGAGVGLVTLLQLALFEIFVAVPLFFYWPVVILAGWAGGFGPGLFASILAVSLSNYFFLAPRFSFASSPADLILLVLFVGITSFISWLRERQRISEMTLYQRQQELQVTLSSIGDGVIVTDADARVTFMNDVASRLTGWPQTEAAGKPVAEIFRIVNEHTRQPADLPVLEAVQRGVVIGLANHTLLISKSGEEWPISDSASPIRSSTGEIVGVILVFRDESEQRAAEHSLQASESRHRQLVENATDIIYTLDLENHITSINSVAEQITGYSRDELIGMPLSSLLPVEDFQRTEEMYQRKLAGEEKTTYELNIITKAGQRKTLEINSQLVRQGDIPVSIEGVARDITARKEANERVFALHHISSALAKAITLDEVVSVIIDQTLPVLGAHHGAVGLVSADGQSLELLKLTILSAEISQQYQSTPLSVSGPITDAIRTGEVVWIENHPQYLEQYPHYAELIQTVTKSQAAVALPLRVRERIIGGIIFSFREPQPRTPTGRDFLETIADYCAQSIERALLYQAEQQVRTALQTRVHQQSVVAELGQRALHSSDLVAFMDTTAISLARTLAVEFVKVLELRPEENHLLLKAGVGWSAGYVGHATEGIDSESPAGYTLKAGEPVIVTDLRTETRFSDPPLLHEHNVVSGMSVIIQGYTRPYGVLGVYTTQRRIFSQDDIYFLQSVANVIGAAIENARLTEQARTGAAMEERQRLARELHDSVTQAMFSATTLAEIVPRVWERDPERAMSHLQGVIKLNRGAMAEMRTLLLELRPEAILNNSLKDLYQQLVNAAPARKDILAELIVEGDTLPLPPDAHLALYRIAQESINNSLKHSEATQLRLELISTINEVLVNIIDNGTGFDSTSVQAGFGLGSIRERAEAIGAALHIDSRLGLGTTIRVRYRLAGQA